MKSPLFLLLTTAMAVSALPAQALDILPGLWEFDSRGVVAGGKPLPDMQEIRAQMQKLPPEQRKSMEEMLARQGVEMGDKGVRACLSEEQVRAQALPFQNDRPGCEQEVTERSDQLWRFRFHCPDSQGEGETRFVSEREFTTVVNIVATGKGVTHMESHARWVDGDCGGLKPGQEKR
ncbi:DUF3617 domain-containing protein [Azotobacter vinelandii]|uniref:DUF3617 domain-containing protein n=1 Tax=Azotobacter vinelandii TaxID=354 RepID=UPI002666C1C1|nr:DUF3617 domain-containing protein [Azotobacter vinelandii]WKN22454.1 DUF3617 domain-containing protein [Azotobacter vinelandii]